MCIWVLSHFCIESSLFRSIGHQTSFTGPLCSGMQVQWHCIRFYGFQNVHCSAAIYYIIFYAKRKWAQKRRQIMKKCIVDLIFGKRFEKHSEEKSQLMIVDCRPQRFGTAWVLWSRRFYYSNGSIISIIIRVAAYRMQSPNGTRPFVRIFMTQFDCLFVRRTVIGHCIRFRQLK